MAQLKAGSTVGGKKIAIQDDVDWLLTHTTQNLTSSVTVTVGSGGQFTTINAAIAYLVQTYYPIYISTGSVPQATINLLSGFVMSEQVLVEGLDLSWITITGVDAETTIARSALTKRFSTSYYPAFGTNRGTLPVIDQLFNMDTSGSDHHRVGVLCHFGRCYIMSACGVKNAGCECIHAENGSIVNAYGADASGAGSAGIYAVNGSIINASDANASGAGDYGIVASRGSIINAKSADASGAGSYGIYVASGSIINANSATGTLRQTANTVTFHGIIFQ